MATPAQLAEKALHDRASAPTYRPGQVGQDPSPDPTPSDFATPPTSSDFATPAQLAEKAPRDTSYPSEATQSSTPLGATPAQLAEKNRQDAPVAPTHRPAQPPPLPPRESSYQSFTPLAPPAYTDDDEKRSELISNQWRSDDPRSSSTHSLVPSESGRNGKRTLLLVYIHGFMGNETSFQSFPAHVHNLLTITLEETHLVHTKIYPRYKSRKPINFARDDFSKWLEPHEDKSTDVILIGHSMGGILSAEVALQQPYSPTSEGLFLNRILGTINLDTPFLGMHPGVVVSGIGSLFRPAPDPPGLRQTSTPTTGANIPSVSGQSAASNPNYALSMVDSESSAQVSLAPSISSLSTPPANDPYFNPPFPNDVRLPERKGWDNFMHFVTKHAEGITAQAKLNGLTSATSQYFMSHLEFGGCLADYPGMMERYKKLRGLEDVNELAGRSTAGSRPPVRRIRFVNYYTASTGRPKVAKTKKETEKPVNEEMAGLGLNSDSLQSTPSTTVHSQSGDSTDIDAGEREVALPVEQVQELGESSGVQDDFQEPAEMQHIDSMPIDEDEYERLQTVPSPTGASDPLKEVEVSTEPPAAPKPTLSEPSLPPLPAVPTEPEPVDLSLYTDKDSRKVAEKEHKRVTRVYQQAVKDRETAIKDRQKLKEKREKKAKQEEEKIAKAEGKQRLKEEKEEQKRQAATMQKGKQAESKGKQPETVAKEEVKAEKAEKTKKDRKFCMLPTFIDGKRDECWVRIYMEGVDEVGAHCGLFFPGPQYESLVGDVGARIQQWVREDAEKRAALGV